MIAIEAVAARFDGLAPQEIARWIERRWVHAEPAPDGGWLLTDVDVARVGLLVELRVTLEVTDELLPLVLSLLDQLYDARRTLRGLLAALEAQPDEVRGAVLAAAQARAGGPSGEGGVSP